MNAVGIDVSKGKSMVTILRPFGEIVSSPFEIKHTSSDIHSLIKLIQLQFIMSKRERLHISISAEVSVIITWQLCDLIIIH